MKKTLNKIKAQMKFIKKYQKYIIGLIIITGLFILRLVILRQPDEKLTYTINRDSLSETVQVTGTYTTSAQTKVFSPTNGIISKLYVSNHDQVKKGDPLFYVESTATKEQKAAAYAAYQQALTSLQTAKQAKESIDVNMWVKKKNLLDTQNNLDYLNDRLAVNDTNPATNDEYTELEIESIRSTLTQAQKNFKALENQYKQADQNIASAQAVVNSKWLTYQATETKTVYSPANGEVVNLLKKTNDGVSQQSLGDPVLLVANLKEPSIIAKVSEVDMARISKGQQASIVFDADRKSVFTGKIETIDTIGKTKAGITTYDIRINIDDLPSSTIKPNMTATTTIKTYHKDDVLAVPNSAIIHKNDKTFVQKANKTEDLLEVKVGYQGLVKTEITNDLPEGLEILANANSK